MSMALFKNRREKQSASVMQDIGRDGINRIMGQPVGSCSVMKGRHTVRMFTRNNWKNRLSRAKDQ